MHGPTPDRPAAPVDAPRPGAAGHATAPAEAGAPFAAWCRQFTRDDVIASALMATTRDELGACLRVWMHVHGPDGWATANITALIPSWWPSTRAGVPPRTFPELVGAVRRQFDTEIDPGREA